MEPWRPPAALAGLLAAVGIALKPYFILFWVSTATYAWLATRGRPVWRDPEHLVIAGSHAIYAAAVLTLAPGYLEVVRRLGTTYLERWCLQMPGEDLRRSRPVLVLVRRPLADRPESADLRIDNLAYLSQDPTFAQEFQNYRLNSVQAEFLVHERVSRPN